MASARNSSHQVNETFDQMVQDLICHLCQRYPQPEDQRWYKCSEYHHICQYCVESQKIEKCSCQGNISKKVDKMTEALLRLKTWMIKCPYCSESHFRENINVHKSECARAGRVVPCILANYDGSKKCSLKTRYEDILLHYDSVHRRMPIIENGETRTGGNRMKSDVTDHYAIWPKKTEAYGRVFIRSAIARNGVFYEWIQLLGSPSDAKEFIYSLEYKGPKSTHVYLGEVASIDDNLETIIATGKCSSIGFESFKYQFMDANTTKHTSCITIKKHDEH